MASAGLEMARAGEITCFPELYILKYEGPFCEPLGKFVANRSGLGAETSLNAWPSVKTVFWPEL